MVWSSLVKQYKCLAVSRLSALDAAEETANWIVNKAKLLHSPKRLWQYIRIIAAKQQPPLSYSKVMVKCLREIPAIGSKAICGMSKFKCLPFTLYVTCFKYHSLQQLLGHAALHHHLWVPEWWHHGHLDPLVPWWAMQVRSNAITTSYFNIWVWVNTYRYILVGWTSIYQLFWGSLGTRVLTHPHISLTFSLTFIASGLALSRISTNSQFLLPLINSALLKQHETVKKRFSAARTAGAMGRV